MKQVIFFMMGVAAMLMMHGAIAQNATQRYLIDKLRFYYVENANQGTDSRVVLLNNELIFAGKSFGDKWERFLSGEGMYFWSNNQMEHAQKLVRALLCDQKKGGDYALQSYTYQICKILNKPVQIWLYNDNNIRLNNVARTTYWCSRDTERKVWPTGMSFKDDKEKEWAGILHMGEVNMRSNGMSWAKYVFVHELMHTQDHSNNGAHLYYSKAAKKDYRYGSDEDHWLKEAVPSIFWAYKEGIAQAVSFLYNREEMSEYFNWFANNEYMYVETTLDSKATDISDDVWIYNQIKKVAGEGDVLPGEDKANYRGYKIRNLPARFIVHNEVIIGLMLAKYVEHINLYKFIRAVKQTNPIARKENQQSLAVLIEKLCTLGLPADQTLDEVFGITTGEPKLYLLPLAYIDYFTGYSAQTKADYQAIFDGKLSQQWVDLYWDWMKDAIRNEVSATHPKYDDLTTIAMILDITENVDDAVE